MCPFDTEVGEQRGGVGRLLADTDRPAGCPARAAAVVPDEPVMIRQGGLRYERPEAVGQEARGDQQHRIARASNLKGEFDAVDAPPLHREVSYHA
jgi:hypothetical protein